MIAEQHIKNFRIGMAIPPRERNKMPQLIVRGTYTSQLSVLESDPILMIYHSADHGGDRQMQFFEMSKGKFEAVFYLSNTDVGVDDAVHFQAFSRVSMDGIQHFMPAGHSMMYFSEIESGVKKNLTLSLTSVKYNREEGIVMKKGMIDVSGRVSSSLNYSSNGKFDVIPANQTILDDLASIESVKANAFIGPTYSGSRVLDPYQRELHNIRCIYYDTPIGRLPGASYFAMLDMPPAQPAALRYLLQCSMKRHGISDEDFFVAVKSLIESRSKNDYLSYEEYVALDIAAEGLTLLPNSVPYLSDLATTQNGMFKRSTLQIVELFDDALRRLTGDCEDFAKIIGWIFRSVCALRHGPDPLLDAWASILENYVPCASLLSVLGAKHGDGDDIAGIPQINDPSLFNRVGAHMACFLINANYFAKSLGVSRLPDGVAGGDYKNTTTRKFPTLTLEGTGQMQSMIDTYSAYMERGDDLYHDYQAMNAALYIGSDPGNAEYVQVPRFLQKWEERSITEATSLSDMAIPNNFYRIIVWLSVMGDDLPSVNGKTMRNVVPVTDGKYGLPIMHIVRSKEMKLIATPQYEPETEQYIHYVKKHFAPAAPIARPTNIQYAAEIENAFKKFEDAGKAAMRGKQKSGKATRPIIRTRKMVNKMDDREISAFWDYMKKNKFVESVDTWLEHVYDGLANIVVRINIHK